MKEICGILLRGIGQVMFQNNALSGLLMLAGIAVGSWRAALLALCGNIAGTLTAWLKDYPMSEIRDGLYGFNGALVGIAVGVFFCPGWEAVVLAVAGAAVSTWLARLFLVCRKPGFTAPFIIATWGLLGIVALLCPSLRLVGADAVVQTTPAWLQTFSFHFGQVMFEGTNILTGILFLAGIAINDRRGAAYALWGAVLPLTAALFLSDFGAFNAGMYGYNGVLCVIALAGSSFRDFVWATSAVLFSVALQALGMQGGIVTLTAPFVLSVWLVLLLRRITTIIYKISRP